MKDSSSPLVTGVLSIVSGVFGIFTGVALVLFAVFFMNIESFTVTAPHDFPFDILQAVWMVWGIIILVLAVLAIIGGIYAIQRKLWGLALAGAIVSMLVFLPTGIAAVVFVGLSRREFE
jgi:hypothetical protein